MLSLGNVKWYDDLNLMAIENETWKNNMFGNNIGDTTINHISVFFLILIWWIGWFRLVFGVYGEVIVVCFIGGILMSGVWISGGDGIVGGWVVGWVWCCGIIRMWFEVGGVWIWMRDDRVEWTFRLCGEFGVCNESAFKKNGTDNI